MKKYVERKVKKEGKITLSGYRNIGIPQENMARGRDGLKFPVGSCQTLVIHQMLQRDQQSSNKTKFSKFTLLF
jgi:hypothetical protein